MNPEIKTKWVEALMSGKYAQGRHVLRSADNKYCCLGVLCDLMQPEWWGKSPIYSPHPSVGYFYGHRGYGTMLPDCIKLACGLSDGECSNLANMNDDGCSFEQIANHIKETL